MDQPFCTIVIALLILKTAVGLALNRMNAGYIKQRPASVPEALKAVFTLDRYERARQYALSKEGFSFLEELYGAFVLAAILFSGVLPWAWAELSSLLGVGVWGNAFSLFLLGFVLSVPDWPWEWWSQFKIEEKFGFNRSSQALWISDKLKGFLLAALIGLPVIAALLWFCNYFETSWWLVACIFLIGIQILMLVLYPMLIVPLFNKLSPLEEGELKTRLMGLSERTGFKAKTIQVIDGSKRSGHSNAYFTGFGRFRRIVLFDTLIEQMNHDEIEAVLAHEIGHYRKGHVLKMLLSSTLMLFLSFAVLYYLSNQAWFYEAFGFSVDSGMAPALLLFSMLSGLVSFWIAPLMNALSRKHEYEADRFAAESVKSTEPLKSALRRLTDKNLSFPQTHPFYNAFYFSHPALLERERALDELSL